MIGKRKNRIISAMLLMMMLSLPAAGYPDAPGRKVVIAILPCSDVLRSFQKFHPLMAWLEKNTGEKIETVLPGSEEEFELALRKDEVDFALQDPHIYIRLAGLYDRNSLLSASGKKGENYQYGIVIVLNESRIKKIEDLKGKTVMFGPRFSSVKWVAARKRFMDAGIDIKKDLRGYLNGDCCEDIAFNVYMKEVDAGVVCDHFPDEYGEGGTDLGMDIRSFRTVAETERIPQKVFAARRNLDKGIVSSVINALLSLDNSNPSSGPEERNILESAETMGFRRAADSEYDGMRALMSEIPE